MDGSVNPAGDGRTVLANSGRVVKDREVVEKRSTVRLRGRRGQEVVTGHWSGSRAVGLSS